MNPALGRYDRDPRPAPVKKRVMVVGGGPAGMEAACTAAACGHEVTLYEKSSQLGGHLPLAAMIKGTYLDNVELAQEYLEGQVGKLPITVKLNTEVDIELVKSEKPDVVVIASGGRYEIGPIVGETRRNHTDVNRLQAMADIPTKLFTGDFLNAVTKHVLPGVGKNVVVVGSGIAGLQGALWLKKRNRNVTVVSPGDEVGDQMPPRFRNRLLPWFEDHGVNIINKADDLRITNKGMYLKTPGYPKSVPCDTALTLPGMSSATELYEAVLDEGIPAYLAGSVKGEGNDLIVDAIRDGREVGLKL